MYVAVERYRSQDNGNTVKLSWHNIKLDAADHLLDTDAEDSQYKRNKKHLLKGGWIKYYNDNKYWTETILYIIEDVDMPTIGQEVEFEFDTRLIDDNEHDIICYDVTFRP